MPQKRRQQKSLENLFKTQALLAPLCIHFWLTVCHISSMTPTQKKKKKLYRILHAWDLAQILRQKANGKGHKKAFSSITIMLTFALFSVNMRCCRSTRRLSSLIKICLAWRSTLPPFASMELQWSQYSWGASQGIERLPFAHHGLDVSIPLVTSLNSTYTGAHQSIFSAYKITEICIYIIIHRSTDKIQQVKSRWHCPC